MLWCCIDMRLTDEPQENPLCLMGALGGYSKSLLPSGVIPTSLARVPGRPHISPLGGEFRVSPRDLLFGVSLLGGGPTGVGVEERVEGFRGAPSARLGAYLVGRAAVCFGRGTLRTHKHPQAGGRGPLGGRRTPCQDGLPGRLCAGPDPHGCSPTRQRGPLLVVPHGAGRRVAKRDRRAGAGAPLGLAQQAPLRARL